MTDTPTVSYFTVTIAEVDGKQVVCFVSCDNRQTHNHITDVAGARTLVKNLTGMIDFIDPPPKQWQVTETDDAKLVAKLSDDIKDATFGLAEKAAAILQRARKRPVKHRTSKRSRPKRGKRQ